jgi:hypothetical protein
LAIVDPYYLYEIELLGHLWEKTQCNVLHRKSILGE